MLRCNAPTKLIIQTYCLKFARVDVDRRNAMPEAACLPNGYPLEIDELTGIRRPSAQRLALSGQRPAKQFAYAKWHCTFIMPTYFTIVVLIRNLS
jgi:hypothetical protein